jgi:hypothetical protein
MELIKVHYKGTNSKLSSCSKHLNRNGMISCLWGGAIRMCCGGIPPRVIGAASWPPPCAQWRHHQINTGCTVSTVPLLLFPSLCQFPKTSHYFQDISLSVSLLIAISCDGYMHPHSFIHFSSYFLLSFNSTVTSNLQVNAAVHYRRKLLRTTCTNMDTIGGPPWPAVISRVQRKEKKLQGQSIWSPSPYMNIYMTRRHLYYVFTFILFW